LREKLQQLDSLFLNFTAAVAVSEVMSAADTMAGIS
jgi:hypothetical protein